MRRSRRAVKGRSVRECVKDCAPTGDLMAKRYDPQDRFFHKAKEQGFRARSAFKIEEILRRQRLLGKGGAVLDLGAAPGGFLQVLADVVGPQGVAVGVDIVEIRGLG